MPYTNFTLDDLEEKFGVTNRDAQLFDIVESLQPSDWLIETLKRTRLISKRTEKSKSELILAPILVELIEQTNNYFAIYSGEVLKADIKNGLNGECDFLLSKNTGSHSISLPILSVVEAKKDDMDLGIAQCAAQMVGVNIYNINKNKPVTVIYGCATNADNWHFLKLEDNKLWIDTTRYYFADLPKILGVFNQIFNYYKATIG
jgi:hypothetical protein